MNEQAGPAAVRLAGGGSSRTTAEPVTMPRALAQHAFGYAPPEAPEYVHEGAGGPALIAARHPRST